MSNIQEIKDRLEIKTTREAELERRVAFLENEIIDLISEIHRLRNRFASVVDHLEKQ